MANESAKSGAVAVTTSATGPDWTAMPAVPTGLAAVGGNGQARLTWNPVTNALSYNVYAAQGPPGVATALIANVTTASFLHSGLGNGQTWNYQVTAVN